MGAVHAPGEFVQGLAKAEPVYPAVEAGFIERLKKAPEMMPR